MKPVDSSVEGEVLYLLHYEAPLNGGQRPRHYLGWTNDLTRRLEEHQNGTSRARITQVFAERGVAFELVRVWPGGNRTLEAELKRRKNHHKLCPRCREQANRKEQARRRRQRHLDRKSGI